MKELPQPTNGKLQEFRKSYRFATLISSFERLLDRKPQSTLLGFEQNLTGRVFEQLSFLSLAEAVTSPSVLYDPERTYQFFKKLYAGDDDGKCLPDGVIFEDDSENKALFLLEYTAKRGDSIAVKKYIESKQEKFLELQANSPDQFGQAQLVIFFTDDMLTIIPPWLRRPGVILGSMPYTYEAVHSFTHQLAVGPFGLTESKSSEQ